MRWMLLFGWMIAVLWAVPAQAGDDKDIEIANLRAQLSAVEAEKAALANETARVSAEVKHLREAYNEMSHNATRGHRAIETMTNSLNAARDMITTLQSENARLREVAGDRKVTHEDDVAQLQKTLQAMTDRANELTILMEQPEHATKKRVVALEAKLEAVHAKLAKAEAALAEVRKALK